MQVSGLLNLMGNLSLGNDNITQVERSIFLQYLNLAHLELYQVTANFNQDLLEKYDAEIPANTHEHDLGFTPYLINEVWVGASLATSRKLKRKSLAALLATLPVWQNPGTLEYYYLRKQVIGFVPKSTVPFEVMLHYVPQPITLTEQTPEQDIPYPLAYHPVLVDGALYYLFQEEGGFKNLQKAQAAQERWELGKERLIAYLYNSSGTSFSTFSSV
jgi:hypothetical protein